MSSNSLIVSNYCACFIDLLGQKDALKGQSVMPELIDDQKKAEFQSMVMKSVGAITRLQQHAEFFRRASDETESIRGELAPADQLLYDEMSVLKAKQQRWSDGLVFYQSLNTKTSKCPMNAVLDIFMLAGSLCMLGLVDKQPIRGAVETSWGVELHESELYGAVVANSYVLESSVAQYPRIVIGEHTMSYLRAHLEHTPDPADKLDIYNRNLAVKCLNMTAIDQDGYNILNYLGAEFKSSVFREESKSLYDDAYVYICDQYELHKENKNSTLALRYSWLKGYFHQHRDIHV
ncbi:hypothetical protein [Zhongshania arctica]|uniref:Uncharacterized protein n=1 Tax=Zhongshania arctica TaxID=3238302 RepID=A0ABV3TU17_9GAMM